MHFFNQLIGALVEAWGEVKVQKARVILSLVGVVAAVTAMTIVIALGQITEQFMDELQEAYSGREITLHVDVQQQLGGDGGVDQPAGEFAEPGFAGSEFADPRFGAGPGLAGGPPGQAASGRGEDIDGRPLDQIGDAMATVAERFKIPYWSRKVQAPFELRELNEAQNTGFFRGKPAIFGEYGFGVIPSLNAVDPDYQTIFRLRLLTGRWLQDSDWEMRVSPVVLNETLWEMLGKPDLADPLVLHANDDSGRQLRAVGVVKRKTQYEGPEFFVSYQSWQYLSAGPQPAVSADIPQYNSATPTMVVWVGKEQLPAARKNIPAALGAVLGDGWSAAISNDGGMSAPLNNNAFTVVIIVIGAIVIFLGALGLLNVAIVTVKQRIREIGIRRAMGASAKRVFFAVFMESVAATFAAGVIGVGLAIVVLRMIPLQVLGIYLQEQPPFPLSAAVIGVLLATSVGALCGIIPAAAAVRVKPIDAIRY